MVEQKFVDKIAARYIDVYRTLGHEDAVAYADRMVGKDSALHELVRLAAEKILSEDNLNGKTS